MQKERMLHGTRISISGSAGHSNNGPIDQTMLRRSHEFVYHLTLGILRAGGEIVAFVGNEPRLNPDDPFTAKVFYWTQLEAIAAYLPQRVLTHQDRPLLHAIVSVRSAQGEMPTHRRGLWTKLLQTGAVEQVPLDDRYNIGGHQRERQAAVADVMVTLGGGKGIFDLDRQFRERKSAIVPLDARIGSSSNDVEGDEASVVLNREALLNPKRFVPESMASWFRNQLPLLSFAGETLPEVLAQRSMEVLLKISVLDPTPLAQTQTTARSLQDVRTEQTPSRLLRPLPETIHFLVLADEWLPNKGGLSAFNRDLCLGLSRAGHHVSLFLPRAGIEQTTVAVIAKEHGISVVHSQVQPTSSNEPELFLKPKLSEQPDVVIGHGMVTGPAARAQREQHFPQSLLVQFVHTLPGEIEHRKDKPPATAMKEAEDKERRQVTIVGDADLVAAVGPRLTRGIKDDLHSWQMAKSVHEFLPWLPQYEPLRAPNQKAALWIGRADAAHLKGLDLAVRAMSGLQDQDPNPVLFIRGVELQGAEWIETQSKTWSNGRVDVRLREYTAEETRVEQSFRRATVVLMPSRAEGYGLVGMEALARGIPLLASSTSGLGELLRAIGGELGESAVVDISENDNESVDRLTRKLQEIWNDPAASFERARKLREVIVPHLNEKQSIDSFIRALREISRNQAPAHAPDPR